MNKPKSPNTWLHHRVSYEIQHPSDVVVQAMRESVEQPTDFFNSSAVTGSVTPIDGGEAYEFTLFAWSQGEYGPTKDTQMTGIIQQDGGRNITRIVGYTPRFHPMTGGILGVVGVGLLFVAFVMLIGGGLNDITEVVTLIAFFFGLACFFVLVAMGQAGMGGGLLVKHVERTIERLSDKDVASRLRDETETTAEITPSQPTTFTQDSNRDC